MALAQMAADAFWSKVTDLEHKAKLEATALEAQKLKLQRAYSAAKRDPDPERSADNRALLDPLIHKNSALRLEYRELVANFNRAVDAARSFLERAGLRVPSGLGQAQLLVPVVAVAALGTALAILGIVASQRRSLDRAIDNAIRVANDPSASPEERKAAREVLEAAARTTPKGTGPFDFSSLIPVLGILALIVLGPSLLSAFRGRRAAA